MSALRGAVVERVLRSLERAQSRNDGVIGAGIVLATFPRIPEGEGRDAVETMRHIDGEINQNESDVLGEKRGQRRFTANQRIVFTQDL